MSLDMAALNHAALPGVARQKTSSPYEAAAVQLLRHQ
jgi:hypothetical protein